MLKFSSTPPVGASAISLNKNVLYYPENYKDYSCILKGIPNIAYTTPIGKKLPKDCTESASTLAGTYRTMLDEIVKKAALNNITLKTTFYPTLTSANGDNTIARVKFEFSSVLKVDDAVWVCTNDDGYPKKCGI